MSNQNIPKFESTVDIKPAGVPQVQGAFSASGSIFAKITNSALASGQELANQKAAIEGAEAGEEPGLKLAPGVTEATRAFNKSALSSNKTFNLLNIKTEAQGLHSEITNPKNFSLEADPINTFKNKYSQFSTQYMQGVPAENRESAQNALNYYGGVYLRSIQGKVQTLAYNTHANFAENGLDDLNAQITHAALLNNDKGMSGLIRAHTALVDNSVTNKTITPGYGVFLKNDIQSKAHFAQIVGGAHEAASQGVLPQYIKDVQKSKLPTLSGADKSRLILTLRGVSAQRATTDMVQNNVRNDTFQNQLLAEQKGKETRIEQSIEAMRPINPARASALQFKLDGTRIVATALIQTKFASFADRSHLINSTEAELINSNNPQRIKFLKEFQRGVRTQTVNMLNDPASFSQQTPAYQNSVQAYKLAVTAFNESASSPLIAGGKVNVDELLKPRINSSKLVQLNIHTTQTSLAQQAEWGIPVDKRAVLTNIQSAAVVTNYTGLSADAGLIYLDDFLNMPQHKKFQSIIMRNLKKHGLPDQVNWGLVMVRNPKTAKYVGAFQRSQSIPAVEFDKIASHVRDIQPGGITKSDVDRKLTDALSPYMGSVIDGANAPTSTYRQNIRTAVMRFAYILADNTKDKLGLSEAIKVASDSYANDHYHFFTLNNKRVRAPLSVDIKHAQDALNQTTVIATAPTSNLQIGSAFAAPWVAAGVPRSKIEARWKESLRSHGYWVSLPDTTGYMFVDSTGSPVMKTNGEKIIITNKELANNNSPLNITLDKSDIPTGPLLFEAGAEEEKISLGNKETTEEEIAKLKSEGLEVPRPSFTQKVKGVEKGAGTLLKKSIQETARIVGTPPSQLAGQALAEREALKQEIERGKESQIKKEE